MTLAHGILQERACVNLDSPILRGDDWVSLVKDSSTKVLYISRDKLHGADKRAKNGNICRKLFLHGVKFFGIKGFIVIFFHSLIR